MDETLREFSGYSVFAPNNDAFKKIPIGTLVELLKPENVDKLRNILRRHVVPNIEILTSANIPNGDTDYETLGGEKITVTKGKGTIRAGSQNDLISITSSVGKATVVKADIKANNGVIHIVDNVF